MKRVLQLTGAVLLVVWPGWCADQKSKPAPPPKPAPAAPAPKNVNANGPNAGGMPRGGVPKNNVPRIPNPGLAQRLLQMTPEQRERAFEKLPAANQEQLRKQLEKLDQLPQAAKDQLARQARGLDSLSPAQHRLVTQQLYAFNHLPDNRIAPVRKELIQLVRMPEEERTARLNSEEFKKQYSAEEQGILRDLSHNLPLDYLPGR